MENSREVLHKLKSIYIFANILKYIKDKNFKFKLLKYSNSLKEKYNLKKNDYINKYIDFVFNEEDQKSLFSSSLFCYDCKKCSEYKESIKDYSKKYKIEKSVFEQYLLNIIEKRIEKTIPNEVKISIFSHFFKQIIQKYIDNLTLEIDIESINKYNLKNDCYNIFDMMNKSNINYSSLYFEKIEEEKNFIKNLFSKKTNYQTFFNSLNINYDIIKKLSCRYDVDFNKKNGSEIFYKSLLSCFHNKSNLIYLNLAIYGIQNDIDIINEFKSLKKLYLRGFVFDKKKLIISLLNLEEISLKYCKHIILDEQAMSNIKYLELSKIKK